MKLIKCRLCGFEFEHGSKICQGCHGTVKYGAGGCKWFFGLLYAALVWYACIYVHDNWIQISDDFAFTVVGVCFVLGVIHAAYMFRDSIQVVKTVGK